MKKIALFIGLIMAAIIAVAYGDNAGTATPNTILNPSACQGYNTADISTAVSEAFWNDGAACGSVYTITCVGPTNLGDLHPCTGNSVTVTVVDKCPAPGCQADFDLYIDAFTVIANPDAGKIDITYVQLS